jgi:hypothetical protein
MTARRNGILRSTRLVYHPYSLKGSASLLIVHFISQEVIPQAFSLIHEATLVILQHAMLLITLLDIPPHVILASVFSLGSF